MKLRMRNCQRGNPRQKGIGKASAMILLLGVLSLILLFLCKIPNRLMEALGFLAAVQQQKLPFVGFPSEASLFQKDVLIKGGDFKARFYRDGDHSRKVGIVLVPGLHPKGVDDERFRILAEALARQGFLVLAPDISDFRHFRITETAIRTICESVNYIDGAEGLNVSKIGIFGISYAGGLSLVAASRGEIINKVDFIVSLGGYYNLHNPIEYALTGKYNLDGNVIHLEPHPWVRMIFALNNVDLLATQSDYFKLRRSLECRLELDEKCALQWEQQLSPAGKEIIQTILGPTKPELMPMMSKAVDRISKIAPDFSPETVLTEPVLSHMKARIYLLHGISDTIIPSSETVLLERLLRKRGHTAHRVLISRALTHVDPGANDLRFTTKIWEGIKLVRFVMELFNE